MYEKIEACPLCDERSFENHIIAKDYLVSQESFAIVSCNNCGFKFTNPRPTIEDMPGYYKSEEYISHSNKGSSLVNIVYKIARSFTIKSKIRIVRKYHSSPRIFDFGCGTGHFLHACAKKGWDCMGYEPDDLAAAQAEKYKGVKIIRDLSDHTKDKYNVITLWHVLEHVHQLKETLTTLRKMLSEKGILVVAVPNMNSWDANHYKEYWAGYDVPRHLYHFEKSTILKLMTSLKFRKLEIIPQKLDAFYVSLLSEKYQNQKNKYIQALNNGLKSNRNGKKDNTYSSLIYIFSK